MRLLGFLLRRSRSVVVVSIVTAAIGGAGGVALIALVHAELGREAAPGRATAWAFVGLFLLVAATRFVSQAAMARLGLGAVAELRTLICRKILALPLAKFEAIDSSSLIAILTEDIAIVANALVGIPQVCINLPLVVIAISYLGWLSPSIMLCGAAFAPLAILVYFGLAAPAMRQVRASRKGQDALVGHIRTLIEGFRELKQHRGRSEAFLGRALEPSAAAVRDRAVAGQTLFAMAEGWGQIAFFGFLGFLLFLFPTIRVVDRATLAGIVLVVLYVMGPLDVILTWLPILGRARASMQRVEALVPSLEVEEPAEPSTTQFLGPRPSLLESLRLEGVTYEYRGDSDRPGFALGPVDLTLRPGELVILAGGNGSGKTTLVKVLAGLYTADDGAIRLDGRAIADEDLAAYRQLFSVVFADGYLFKDRLGIERPGLDAEAGAGLERLGLGDRVGLDGDVYSTLDLSQGQRRRLALLNARLEDRPVCIFDEWAANQDPRFRRAFYREILPELRDLGKALLVISHDEEYYDVADRIVRLRDGRFVGDDTPDPSRSNGRGQASYTGNPS
jgi:putative ATP-binding cassette transporter